MMDFSMRIVATAARLLPADRRDWGAAMKAELAQIDDAPARVRFALGCVRASILAPRRPDTSAGVTVTSTLLVGVAACVAMTWYTLAAYPIAVQDLSRSGAVRFAVVLTAYLWIALRPPRVLVANRAAVRIGAVLGFTLNLALSLGTWAIDSVVPAERAEDAGDSFLFLAVVGTFVGGSAIVAARERSFRSGLVVAAWAGMVTALLGFSCDLLGTLRGLNLAAHVGGSIPRGSLPDLDHFLTKHIGEHLSASMRNLAAFPAMALLLGAIGAAIGYRRRPRTSRAGFVAA